MKITAFYGIMMCFLAQSANAREELVYARGWTELRINANAAHTQVNTFGHYLTDKNMCQRKGSAVYTLPTWNHLASLLNSEIRSVAAQVAVCVPSPQGSYFWNLGIAEVGLESGESRQLFVYRNAEICSYIQDASVRKELIDLIEETIRLADRADAEDCPNFRP